MTNALRYLSRQCAPLSLFAWLLATLPVYLTASLCFLSVYYLRHRLMWTGCPEPQTPQQQREDLHRTVGLPRSWVCILDDLTGIRYGRAIARAPALR